MRATPTPELDKMLSIKEKSQPIGEFIDWLRDEEHVHLMTYVEPEYDPIDEYEEGRWQPYTPTVEQMLAKFFGIDLDKCEQERLALLEAVREANEEART